MVSSWSTYEKLACLYCIKNNKAFTLENDGKTYFLDCHQRFLPTDHKYTKNKKNFFIGRVEKDVASPLPLGEELYDVVLQYDDIVYSFQSDTSWSYGQTILQRKLYNS
jgi:hypothetical protein